MTISNLIFPQESRYFSGQRWLNIALRTAHLVGISGVGGGFLFNLEFELWRYYLILTLVSGSLMMAIESWSNGVWLIQLRGFAIFLKLSLLAILLIIGANSLMMISVIVISGVIAHAPAKVRYYYIFKWRPLRSD